MRVAQPSPTLPLPGAGKTPEQTTHAKPEDRPCCALPAGPFQSSLCVQDMLSLSLPKGRVSSNPLDPGKSGVSLSYSTSKARCWGCEASEEEPEKMEAVAVFLPGPTPRMGKLWKSYFRKREGLPAGLRWCRVKTHGLPHIYGEYKKKIESQ